MPVSVSCPNRRRRASTLVAYIIFSRSGSPTNYIRAPVVRDRKRSFLLLVPLSQGGLFFKLVYPSFEVSLPVIFFRPKAELFLLESLLLLAVPASGLRSFQCSKIKPDGSVVHGGLRPNSLLLPFFFEGYLGVRIHACGHLRSARRRSNNTATSVTTVPLSVCYGALNLTLFPML